LDAAHAHLTFTTPLRDITPGQSVVFYVGDQLLGGGVIVRPKNSETLETFKKQGLG
jgi:tRNA-specific 2-thiouridylase